MTSYVDPILDWIERDGPRLAAPLGDGFGTSFIKRAIEYELRGRAELQPLPDGLRCTLAFQTCSRGSARSHCIGRIVLPTPRSNGGDGKVGLAITNRGVAGGLVTVAPGLGRRAADWDLATDARPEQVGKVFPKVLPTGIAHGTVTVRHRGQSFEVTTLRGEGAYSDGRRPDTVSFVKDIEEDLSRRDFTVNALAYDPLGERLVDPFGGQDDLAARRIRAVGGDGDGCGRVAARGVHPDQLRRQHHQSGEQSDRDIHGDRTDHPAGRAGDPGVHVLRRGARMERWPARI